MRDWKSYVCWTTTTGLGRTRGRAEDRGLACFITKGQAMSQAPGAGGMVQHKGCFLIAVCRVQFSLTSVSFGSWTRQPTELEMEYSEIPIDKLGDEPVCGTHYEK
ncbi:hypothetical protein GOP47_0030577 [Adiantum capillus-veneris]|nr:hypothetical protein GOP47_0030577 [Adiantum capillus-veneris]